LTTVSQRVREGRLLGRHPAADGRLDPQRPVTGWTVAAWLTSPDPDLDGLTPVAVLQADRPEPGGAVASRRRSVETFCPPGGREVPRFAREGLAGRGAGG
jgi:hypothetical protein